MRSKKKKNKLPIIRVRNPFAKNPAYDNSKPEGEGNKYYKPKVVEVEVLTLHINKKSIRCRFLKGDDAGRTSDFKIDDLQLSEIIYQLGVLYNGEKKRK